MRSTKTAAEGAATLLLPVTVQSPESTCLPLSVAPVRPADGTIEIAPAGARVRVRGHVDEDGLRCVLQALRAFA